MMGRDTSFFYWRGVKRPHEPLPGNHNNPGIPERPAVSVKSEVQFRLYVEAARRGISVARLVDVILADIVGTP